MDAAVPSLDPGGQVRFGGATVSGVEVRRFVFNQEAIVFSSSIGAHTWGGHAEPRRTG